MFIGVFVYICIGVFVYICINICTNIERERDLCGTYDGSLLPSIFIITSSLAMLINIIRDPGSGWEG